MSLNQNINIIAWSLIICRQVPYKEPQALLSDLSRPRVANEIIKNTGSEADYEMLDNYNPDYEDIKVVEPLSLPDRRGLPPSSVGDYNITQCPAYIPIAHGNQQAETSLIQSAGTATAKTRQK